MKYFDQIDWILDLRRTDNGSRMSLLSLDVFCVCLWMKWLRSI